MQKLQLNSTRIWLSYRGYNQIRVMLKNPELHTHCLRLRITTMPVIRNNPIPHLQRFRKIRAIGVKAIIDAVKDEGLLMWDIMNEPSYCDYCEILRRESETRGS
jgi:hypothetical protein